jgi:PAS domain-containing protein
MLGMLAGTLSVLAAIGAMRFWDRRQRNRAPRRIGADNGPSPIIFLFRNRKLIDATSPARTLLDRIAAPKGEWHAVMRWIGPRFPGADAAFAGLELRGRCSLTGLDPKHKLIAQQLSDEILRITIFDPETQDSGIVVDAISHQAMEDELQMLRRSLDRTPMLVWRMDQAGQVTWANTAYLQRAEAHIGEPVSWPLPRLLDIPRPGTGSGAIAKRASLDNGGAISWYDCHSHPFGDQTMHFALPADAAVRAERSLREFVQTLTKTFADLPIGLAIFDRQRRLQLFNPALIDLTRLSSSFLTARPSLFDLLDQLRERRMVPEPKNYHSWRQRMNDLENAATIGHHVETWSLPGGQTYRVTGRPHPDGAVAFLFEDITSEISLTRKFRADLSLGENILDGLDNALVVFAANGQILQTNRAYRNLMGQDGASLAAATQIWRTKFEAGSDLAKLITHLSGKQSAPRSDGDIRTRDGQVLRWRVTRIAGAKILLQFQQPEPVIERTLAGTSLSLPAFAGDIIAPASRPDQ